MQTILMTQLKLKKKKKAKRVVYSTSMLLDDEAKPIKFTPNNKKKNTSINILYSGN